MGSITNTVASIGIALISMLSPNNTNEVIPQEQNNTIIEVVDVYDSGEEIELDEQIDITEERIKVDPVATSKESTMPYYVKVNIAQNVVNVYGKDESGDYSIFEKVMLCSTGKSTPKAGKKYKLTSYRVTWNKLIGGVYGQYAVQINGNILFHSVPYSKKNKSALEYEEYDKLGQSASLGCIRLCVADAKWVYDNVWAGTTVEFYEDDNPGPGGKPELAPISDNLDCRNWDPTDYTDGNPWHIAE
ncbi:MAG: L,D-transpeptidase [Clostridia bacterium]|nr:L,D-transpeptidase [Clostridia bacterium]